MQEEPVASKSFEFKSPNTEGAYVISHLDISITEKGQYWVGIQIRDQPWIAATGNGPPTTPVSVEGFSASSTSGITYYQNYFPLYFKLVYGVP
mgnify:CR=1 FL=1